MTTLRGVISYPIPIYQNVPIHAEYYQPNRFVITAITLGQSTTVTTSIDHNFVIGQEVRLLIPANCGSYQLNEEKGYVISIPSVTQVIIDIDSSVNVNAFISGTGICNPQILAIGDINQGQTNSNGPLLTLPYIPGSFLDISPL